MNFDLNNSKTQNQQIQNVPQKQIIDKPKYVSNNVGSPNNASIKNRFADSFESFLIKFIEIKKNQ